MSNSEIHETLEGMLEQRMTALETGAGERATIDQRHLQEGSDERAYWHYGYASALKDVLTILKGTSPVVN